MTRRHHPVHRLVVRPTQTLADTFVIAGTADECRRKLEPVWEVADSFLLVPPFAALPPDKVLAYSWPWPTRSTPDAPATVRHYREA